MARLAAANELRLQAVVQLEQTYRAEAHERIDAQLRCLPLRLVAGAFAGASADVARGVRGRLRVILGRWLEERGLRCWVDIEEMSGDIYSSMAAGVQGAAVVYLYMIRKVELLFLHLFQARKRGRAVQLWGSFMVGKANLWMVEVTANERLPLLMF